MALMLPQTKFEAISLKDAGGAAFLAENDASRQLIHIVVRKPNSENHLDLIFV